MSEKFISFLNSFINFESRLHQTSAQEFSLEMIQLLLERLGHSQKKIKVIHVAGTKGKGSTSLMIASILKEAGFSVGLYTSPHLYDVNERIRILRKSSDFDSLDHEVLFADAISDQDLNSAVEETRAIIQDVHQSSSRGLTFFEVLTAIALYHFAKKKVDWVVLETGLGGRLDATNAVDSVAAVITPISLDHQNILGDTIEQIAVEKAGIIKSSSQMVIIAQQVPVVADILLSRCREFGITPLWVEKNVSVEFIRNESQHQILNFKTPACEYNNIQLSLMGAHQRLNASTAVCVAEALKVSFAAGRLNSAFSSLNWPGRFEIISENPTVILDCAHNEDSVRVLLNAVHETFPRQKPCFVLGISEDKNIASIARLLQNAAQCVILTRADHPRARAFTVADIEKNFSDMNVVIVDSSVEAVEKAKKNLNPGDVIVVTGSVFLVAEVRKKYVSI